MPRPLLSGSTHLVERRNSQVVRLLGSLNWLMSRSLSKAGVLPSSPKEKENHNSWITVCVYMCSALVGVIPSSTKRLFLVLYSGVTPGSPWGIRHSAKDQPRSAPCKAVDFLSLAPRQMCFKKWNKTNKKLCCSDCLEQTRDLQF